MNKHKWRTGIINKLADKIMQAPKKESSKPSTGAYKPPSIAIKIDDTEVIQGKSATVDNAIEINNYKDSRR